MSFLDFFKGKKENGHRAVLVLNDRFLEVMELNKKGGQAEVMGFNRVELPAGVIEYGAILSESAFQKALLDLAKNAQPHPLSTEHLLVSVPFNQFYSFIKKGTSRNDPEASKKLLLEEIRKESPLPPEEMNFQFYWERQRNTVEIAAIGWSKTWENMLREACGEIGVQSLELVPEPFAQLAIADSPTADHFALASWQEKQLFLTLFHHRLLYDSFLMECRGKDLKGDLKAYRDQFVDEVSSYQDVWGAVPQMVYFINAPEEGKSLIESLAKEIQMPFAYLDEHRTPLSGQLPGQKYSATLMGLALLSLKK